MKTQITPLGKNDDPLELFKEMMGFHFDEGDYDGDTGHPVAEDIINSKPKQLSSIEEYIKESSMEVTSVSGTLILKFDNNRESRRNPKSENGKYVKSSMLLENGKTVTYYGAKPRVWTISPVSGDEIAIFINDNPSVSAREPYKTRFESELAPYMPQIKSYIKSNLNALLECWNDGATRSAMYTMYESMGMIEPGAMVFNESSPNIIRYPDSVLGYLTEGGIDVSGKIVGGNVLKITKKLKKAWDANDHDGFSNILESRQYKLLNDSEKEIVMFTKITESHTVRSAKVIIAGISPEVITESTESTPSNVIYITDDALKYFQEIPDTFFESTDSKVLLSGIQLIAVRDEARKGDYENRITRAALHSDKKDISKFAVDGHARDRAKTRLPGGQDETNKGLDRLIRKYAQNFINLSDVMLDQIYGGDPRMCYLSTDGNIAITETNKIITIYTKNDFYKEGSWVTSTLNLIEKFNNENNIQN